MKVNQKSPVVTKGYTWLKRMCRHETKYSVVLLFLFIAMPAPAEEWVQTHGPFGGMINTIEIDPHNPDVLYAGGTGGCVFKTVDGGATWVMLDEIINPSAPSSYTLRGTKRRDIKVWINTLNNMLTEFSGAEFMAPTHGRPVVGNANVIRRISEYKKGTEEMYEQTMALMNEGMLPDEIEHKVKVSDELNVPWNYYDHYNYQASFPRAIYQNYLGHYNGDPYTLIINQESHPADRACYYADDNKRTFRKVEQLVRDGELAFASELLTYIIRCPSTTDVNREKAKLLKSDLYMKLAEDQTSSNLRNWLISDAQILQGKENKLDINFAVKRV